MSRWAPKRLPPGHPGDEDNGVMQCYRCLAMIPEAEFRDSDWGFIMEDSDVIKNDVFYACPKHKEEDLLPAVSAVRLAFPTAYVGGLTSELVLRALPESEHQRYLNHLTKLIQDAGKP